MCGIVGAINLREPKPIPEEMIRDMLGLIQHRGPDEFGIYLDEWIGMGSARLSILDLSTGQQPISNEDGTLWIVYNGEIFNYLDLRPGLEQQGHVFTTNTDTEVILHMYEEYGTDCLKYLNGQFAIAIWDQVNRQAFFARDRLGIRPFFYTIQDSRMFFGSEIKSLLSPPEMTARMDPSRLAEIFTFWSVQSPNTAFKDIFELPPAHWMVVRDGQVKLSQYWFMDFSISPLDHTDEEWQEEFEDLLINATLIRLRADVPVGAYLSGGLDSSTTTALIRKQVPSQLETYSISFSDPLYDESSYQRKMADHLGTRHHIVYCTHSDIGATLPRVIWHTETPILRTAPVPMFMLSRLVHIDGFKVVVTGEGADEFLAGYDIFKEMSVRRFWARDPESKLRPILLKKLYPDISRINQSGWAYLTAFFRQGLTSTSSPWYSHQIRWNNTSRLVRFLANQPDGFQPHPSTSILPENYTDWSPLGQAQFLEISTFLSPYLLSSQGDRVAMANSVEGRFPFLDYRIVEFCNHLPPHLKLNGMLEKYLLRRVAAPLLPPEIWRRVKRPYRAPIHRCFFHPKPLDYVQQLLSPEAIQKSGLFQSGMVAQLVRKATSGADLSEVEDMGLVGILSTQLIHMLFVDSFRRNSVKMPENRPFKRVILTKEAN